MTRLEGASGAAYSLSEAPPASGGQALVYAAICLDDGRPVAVKVAQRSGADGAWLPEEAALLMALAADARIGRYVVPVWDTGTWEGRAFLVMDWFDDTLASWCARQPLRRRLVAIERLAGMIESLHAAGGADPRTVHRDLKPANVLVREEDGDLSLFLADFGAVRPGAHTPGYAPPEQRIGGPVHKDWDRFALAATAWACIAGELPEGPLLHANHLTAHGFAVATGSRSGGALETLYALDRMQAVTPQDRIAFDAAAPGCARVRRVLEAMLAPRPGDRVRDPELLQEAIRTVLDPTRPPAATVGWMSAGASALVASVGAALLSMAAGAEAPPCPTGWSLVPSAGALPACEGPDGRRVVRVPAGRFVMGRRDHDPAYTSDAAAHAVTLSRPFWLSETETTQASYAAIMGENPTATRTQRFQGPTEYACAEWVGYDLVSPDRPVVCVSWYDAVRFANALSVRDGLTPAYRIGEGDTPAVSWDQDAEGWRLPTEAEWEWAARAGTELDYVGTADRNAICGWANVRDAGAAELWGGEVGCRDGSPALGPVRRYAPNAWGLYDLQGNTLEWVWDAYAPFDERARTDPTGPERGATHVLRGGSWNHVARVVATRYPYAPNVAINVHGLRLARTIR